MKLRMERDDNDPTVGANHTRCQNRTIRQARLERKRVISQARALHPPFLSSSIRSVNPS